MPHRSRFGFTLLELMITVAVVGVFAAMAVPGFSSILLQNRVIGFTNQLAADFNLARSESVKQYFPVTVCTANIASQTCDSTLGWQNGWMVFVNRDVLGTYTANSTDLIIKTGQAAPNGVKVTPTGFNTGGYITYLPTGFLNTVSYSNPNAQSGNLLICGYDLNGQAPAASRTLNLNIAGRVSISSSGVCP